jgi:hypothetical protein
MFERLLLLYNGISLGIFEKENELNKHIKIYIFIMLTINNKYVETVIILKINVLLLKSCYNKLINISIL